MKNDTNMSQIKQYAIDTFNAEADAIRNLSNLLTDDFDQAVEAILVCTGKVVVTGMGKSGIIGKKIAATLASTGTPAFFLHPGEAYHGDLGMISKNDVVLAIANSGQTDEVLKLIPFMQNNGNTIIAITGNPQSTLAKNAHFHLNINVGREACPLNLAPTSSTTAMLVMGDALAIALMKMRNFKAEDYAVFHPGGSLGRRLLTRVRDVMRKDGVPCVPKTMTLGEVIIAISDARLGIAAVVENGKLIGVITDGDVRRAMAKYKENFFRIEAQEIMSRNPKTISPDVRITAAEEMMRVNKIHSIIVVDDAGAVEGVRACGDRLGVSQDDEVGHAFGDDLLGCLEGALVIAFGQDDRLLVGSRAIEHGLEEGAHTVPDSFPYHGFAAGRQAACVRCAGAFVCIRLLSHRRHARSLQAFQRAGRGGCRQAVCSSWRVRPANCPVCMVARPCAPR